MQEYDTRRLRHWIYLLHKVWCTYLLFVTVTPSKAMVFVFITLFFLLASLIV